ncbi:hypothetical protein BN1723_020425, partial [Verticillium longisporum]
QHAGHLGD